MEPALKGLTECCNVLCRLKASTEFKTGVETILITRSLDQNKPFSALLRLRQNLHTGLSLLPLFAFFPQLVLNNMTINDK